MSHISHVSRASHVSMGSRRPTLVQNTQDLDMEEPLSISRVSDYWDSEAVRPSVAYLFVILCDLMDFVQPRRYLLEVSFYKFIILIYLEFILISYIIILWLLDLDWVHLITVDEAIWGFLLPFCAGCSICPGQVGPAGFCGATCPSREQWKKQRQGGQAHAEKSQCHQVTIGHHRSP